MGTAAVIDCKLNALVNNDLSPENWLTGTVPLGTINGVPICCGQLAVTLPGGIVVSILTK